MKILFLHPALQLLRCLITMTFYRLRLLLTIVCSLYCLSSTAQASEKAVYTNNIKQLLENWNKNQHLYVKGDIGVKKKDLDKLEQWLDSNAKNWTIILMRNARNEQWKDTRGTTYYGMDAVENAVDRGLSNKIEFLNQLDPSTHEKNGAIFIMFIDERKFSYYASDAYDTRGLGEANWRGNLDAPAIHDMRHGHGIVDAVISTTNSIDIKFANSLRREAEREARRKTELASAKAWVIREGKRQKILINELEKEIGRLLSHNEVKYNDLANPALNDWREIIDNSSKNADPFIAKNAIRKIASEVTAHRHKLQQWNEDHHTLDKLIARLTSFSPHPDQDRTAVAKALTALDEAHELHTTGKQQYTNALSHAQQLILSLETNKTELQRIQAIKARKQEAAEKQKKVAITAGSGATGIGLIGLGIYSNRRRRKQKKLAEQLYQEWKNSMNKRIDQLFKTMDRAGIIVGSERDLPQRGYEGETLEESIKAIRNIDQAFILSSSVHTTLEKAKDLIYPASPLGKTSNIFRRAHYDEAVELLERRPLQTDPKKEKMKVADRGEETMLGDKTKASKVKMKFTELIAEFDHTLATADSSLDLVETSWETIASRCESLGSTLQAIEALETPIQKAAQTDGMYQLDNLYDLWLPKSRQHHEGGIKLGKNDPVKALRTDISRADTMAQEMQDSITLTQKLRKTELSSILTNATALQTLNRDDHWVHQKLIYLDQTLEQISSDGVSQSISNKLTKLSAEAFALKPKTQHACKLANYADRNLPEAIASSQRAVTQTRQQLAAELSLSPDDFLHEHREWDPDVILTDAELFRIRTQDMIDQGHITQAQEQSDRADAKVADSNNAVKQTLMAHSSYQAMLQDLQTLDQDADNIREQAIHLMKELSQTYHSNALLIDPTDSDYGNLAGIEEALLGAERQLSRDITEAQERHAKGHLLHARHRLRKGKDAHKHIAGLDKIITDRRDELRELEQKNTNTLRSLNIEKSALGKATEDHRSTPTTQQFFQQLVLRFKQVTRAVEAPDGEANPFRAAKLLEEVKDRVKALESQIQADRELFDAAQSLANQLVNSHRQGQQLVQQAQDDGITNSRETDRSISTLGKMADRLGTHLKTLDKPHQHWQELYDDLQATAQTLAHSKAILKDELAQAQQALSSLQSANSNVSQAMHWSGSYGVRISGSYGKRSLRSAQDALDSGQYREASSLASSAISAARSAISSAESEVASIRRARAAEERRRRMARRSSSSSFSSFGGSSSSSGSSFSSGSSSSSGGSSSGFSRSGW